jgi:hypothetical protein
MELKLVGKVNEVVSVAVEVDNEELATRYHVGLGYDTGRKVHTISVPSFKVSLETKYPLECDYKLREHKIARLDAETIQEIIAKILYPELQKLLTEVE